MTSLQLPPLTFDDGGFRMSVITGTSQNKAVPATASTSATPATAATSTTASTSSNPNPVLNRAPAKPPQAVQAVPIIVDDDDDDDDDDYSDDQSDDRSDDLSDANRDVFRDQPEEEEDTFNAPKHPIPSMQEAFAESLAEVTKGGSNKPKLRELDVKARRERLLSQGAEDEAFDASWRYRAGQSQHEISKLVAQISFGVYLLMNGMANDTTQVINILQTHIDEVDEFLEVALEDLVTAINELQDWMEQLQLPMANMPVFEEMLHDRTYRAEVIQRNEQVDHVLARTNVIMKQWDDDVDAGLICTTSFNEWLNSIKAGSWRKERPNLVDIYNAMKGNGAGWLSAFDEMNSKAQDMNGLIIRLMTTVAEVGKKAGEISRKTWSNIPPFTAPIPSAGIRKNSGSAASHSIKSSTRSIPTPANAAGKAESINKPQSLYDDDDGLGDFPLPGMTPLLPPVRNSARLQKSRPPEPSRQSKPTFDTPKLDPSRTDSSITESSKPDSPRSDPGRVGSPVELTGLGVSMGEPPKPESIDSPVERYISLDFSPTMSGTLQSPKIRLDTVMESPTLPEATPQNDEEGPLYLLQPRTYTPQLPEPVPSPRAAASPPLDLADAFRTSEGTFPQPRRSIHARASLKANPPQHIRIPSQVEKEHASFASPHTSVFSDHESSSSESPEALRQLYLPRMTSQIELQKQHSFLQSPNSDFQHYHPVRASPHSPLQQRPHTAVDPGRGHSQRPSGYFRPQPNHPHHQSIGPGARNTMGTAPSMAPSSRSRGAQTIAPSMGGKSVAKKKSGAFGWLKKAFTMDEDEKAAFEARKTMQYQGDYYKDKSPKFLDGKRIR
jgi:hypothetical protein